jgi:hypothetical protein
MTTELQTLTLRIEKLERQNRGIAVAALVLLLAFGLAAARTSKPRTIEAEQFIVRDATGRARITIGSPATSGAAYLLPPDEPAIWLSDANGADRLILTADGLRLADSQDKPAAEVTLGKTATIRLYDSANHVVWSAP